MRDQAIDALCSAMWWLSVKAGDVPPVLRERRLRDKHGPKLHMGKPIIIKVLRGHVDIDDVIETLPQSVITNMFYGSPDDTKVPAAPRKLPRPRVVNYTTVFRIDAGVWTPHLSLPTFATGLALRNWREMLALLLAEAKFELLVHPESRRAQAAAQPDAIIGMLAAKCKIYKFEPPPAWLTTEKISFLFDWISFESGGAGQISPRRVVNALRSQRSFAECVRERAESVTAEPKTLIKMLRYADDAQGIKRDDEDRVRARLENLKSKSARRRSRGIMSVYREILRPKSDPLAVTYAIGDPNEEEHDTVRRLTRKERIGLGVLADLRRFGSYEPLPEDLKEIPLVRVKTRDCDPPIYLGVTASPSAAGPPDLHPAVEGAFLGASP